MVSVGAFTMRSILFAVILFTSITLCTGKPGVRCYVCENVEKPEDCTHIGQCATTQQCHIRKYTNTLGYPMFDLGCEATAFCNILTHGKRDVTKRQSRVVQWNRCCNQSYCNIDYDENGGTIQSKGRRCYHCDFVRDPAMCDRVTTCSGDDICFTYEKRNSLGSKGYGLTCKSKEACAHIYESRYEQSTAAVDDTCQGCCDSSSLCSDHICSSILTNTSVPLYTPPPVTTPPPTPYLTIREAPSNVSMRQGLPAEFHCDVIGYPHVTLTWLCPPLSDPCDVHKQPNIIMNDIKTIGQVDSTLNIKNVTDLDIGQYTCEGSTDMENKTAEAYLWLEEFINVTIDPPVVMLVEGLDAVLTCTASGYPAPNVTWYNPPTNDTRFKTRTDSSSSGSQTHFTIKNAKRTDSGTFTCIGENAYGRMVKNVTLGVGIPPSLVKHPKDKLTHLSERVELFCNATGVPTPTLTWGFLSKEGDTFMSLVQVSLDKTRLVIDPVLKENIGSYTCTASNMIGTDNSTAKVTIS